MKYVGIATSAPAMGAMMSMTSSALPMIGRAIQMPTAMMWSQRVPNWPAWFPSGNPVQTSKGIRFG